MSPESEHTESEHTESEHTGPPDTANPLDLLGTAEQDTRGKSERDPAAGDVAPVDQDGVGEETGQEYGAGVDGAPVATSDTPDQET